MSHDRPDPDALLARVQAEEAHRARGRLKIFFGAAPGVGKTYAMLEAGRKLGKEGRDVVVGYIEPHARPETQALVLGLDVLARRQVPYRGTRLLEFDLEAALQRRPEVLLVDELAHTNAPGMTHSKRWQDVMRLLDAGIDVFTTLNVQHLESLSDVVSHITGVNIRETVPDSVLDQADEVELVDISPEDLLERLSEGKVYVPVEAERAVANYFTQGNLIALRELALRRMAERVGTQMDDFRQRHAVSQTWAARERLLVCVGPSPFSARLIRATRRMAASLRAPWIAVHVEVPADASLSEEARSRLFDNLGLAEQLGAETATIPGHRVAEELVAYARRRNVTKIVVGKSRGPRWRDWFRGSLVYELTRQCGDIDVYVISGEAEPSRAAASPQPPAPPRRIAYLWAAGVVALCTAIGGMLFQHLNPANLVMIYLLGVVVVSLRFGRGPSVLAAVLGVAAYDFFFVPPHLTFAVADTQYLFTVLVMLITGLVIGSLTGRVEFQAEAARLREQRSSALYALSRELAATRNREQISRAAIPQVAASTASQVCVLLPAPHGQLVAVGNSEQDDVYQPSQHDQAVARWVFDNGRKAGHGTSTLPGAEALYLPLLAASGTIGVLGVRPRNGQLASDLDRLHLLDTLAGLVALAIERANLAAEAQRIGLQVETERLRSSLLSTVSHDLRTPLAAILGATTTLLEADTSLDALTQRELLESISTEAERLQRLVTNLLNMTRLEAGALAVNKQLQPVEEIIGAVLNRMAPRLREHTVTTRLDPELPLAPLDELLIEQVLVNLLENAAKYAPPNTPIEIRVSREPAGVCLEIADHGPGVPPQDLERIFDKFYRAPNAQTRSGAGLGLAICRGIVELHGGWIRAENRPDGGLIFRFLLPLTEHPPAPASLAASPGAAASPLEP
jgi:two-component system sensor histidine kinase KdpD